MPSGIWLLPAEGRRHKVKACTSMETDGSIREDFALRDLAEKHSEGIKKQSNDDRPTESRRE